MRYGYKIRNDQKGPKWSPNLRWPSNLTLNNPEVTVSFASLAITRSAHIPESPFIWSLTLVPISPKDLSRDSAL